MAGAGQNKPRASRLLPGPPRPSQRCGSGHADMRQWSGPLARVAPVINRTSRVSLVFPRRSQGSQGSQASAAEPRVRSQGTEKGARTVQSSEELQRPRPSVGGAARTPSAVLRASYWRCRRTSTRGVDQCASARPNGCETPLRNIARQAWHSGRSCTSLM